MKQSWNFTEAIPKLQRIDAHMEFQAYVKCNSQVQGNVFACASYCTFVFKEFPLMHTLVWIRSECVYVSLCFIQDSKHEMEILENLEELKEINTRKVDIDYAEILRRKAEALEEGLRRQEVEDEAEIQ